MAYTSPYERKFGKKHSNNPAERQRKESLKIKKKKKKSGGGLNRAAMQAAADKDNMPYNPKASY